MLCKRPINKGFLLMKRLLTLLIIFVVILPVLAQDAEIDPVADASFLEITLPSNFVLDPFIISALAGGNIPASSLDASCAGNIAIAPDVRLNWLHNEDTGATDLRIFFISSLDTTLVIQTPSGDFICNDDNTIDGAEPFDPAIDFLAAEEGTYNIWIGTFSTEEFAPGYLMLTEIGETYPGQIVSRILGNVVRPTSE